MRHGHHRQGSVSITLDGAHEPGPGRQMPQLAVRLTIPPHASVHPGPAVPQLPVVKPHAVELVPPGDLLVVPLES